MAQSNTRTSAELISAAEDSYNLFQAKSVSEIEAGVNQSAKLTAQNPAATVQTLADAITLAGTANLATGELVQTVEYNANTGVGGNTYKLMDSSPSARPAEDGGSVIHVGSGNLYLKGLFLDGVRKVTQYGAIGDYNGTTGTNNLPFFVNAMKGTHSLKVPPGDYYINGDGSANPLIEWFSDSVREMYGEGYKSKITCSSSVVNLLAATGLHIHHMSFDGGFDPNEDTMVLEPLLTLNQNCQLNKCKIENAFGSHVFSKFGPTVITRNEFVNYGDHAFYISTDNELNEITKDIEFSYNIVTQDGSYSNDATKGGREAVKVRNDCENVKIIGNKISGCQIGIRLESDENKIPEFITIEKNHIFPVTNAIESKPQGITIRNGLHIKIHNNVIIDKNKVATSAGIFVDGPCNEVAIENNLIKDFHLQIQNAEGADGLKNSKIAFNTLDGGQYGVFHGGEGAEITNNTVTNFSHTGIRDKFGNKVEDNILNSTESAAIGTSCLVEGSTTQPRRSHSKNKYYNVNNGIHLNGLINAIGLDIYENEFTNCQSNSIWNVNSNTSLDKSNFYNNKVITGPGIFVNKPQGLKIEAGTGLPPASENYRGQTLIREVSNVDTAYVCLKTAVDTYAWIQIN